MQTVTNNVILRKGPPKTVDLETWEKGILHDIRDRSINEHLVDKRGIYGSVEVLKADVKYLLRFIDKLVGK